MEVLSRLKLLNVFTALTLPAVFPSYVIDSQGIYLPEPVQGLNLNRRSISGFEPEMPVTVGTCSVTQSKLGFQSLYKPDCIN